MIMMMSPAPVTVISLTQRQPRPVIHHVGYERCKHSVFSHSRFVVDEDSNVTLWLDTVKTLKTDFKRLTLKALN